MSKSLDKNDFISQDTILKITKEVVVKFIETGRITPATFDENFKQIHSTIKESIKKE